MKYLRTYEEKFNDSIPGLSYDFDSEMEIIRKIIDFFVKNGLDEIDIGYENVEDIILYNADLNWIFRKLGNKEKDILWGTPRNKGIQRLKNIWKKIQNITPEELDILKLKQNAKKYNL